MLWRNLIGERTLVLSSIVKPPRALEPETITPINSRGLTAGDRPKKKVCPRVCQTNVHLKFRESKPWATLFHSKK